LLSSAHAILASWCRPLVCDPPLVLTALGTISSDIEKKPAAEQISEEPGLLRTLTATHGRLADSSSRRLSINLHQY